MKEESFDPIDETEEKPHTKTPPVKNADDAEDGDSDGGEPTPGH